MISTHEFKPWHLDEFEIRPEYKFGPYYHSIVAKATSTSDTPIYTIANDRKPIAVLGATFVYPKAVKVYALIGDGIKACPLAFHKEVKRLVDIYFEECKLTRAEMDVRCDFPQAKRWAKSLGFSLEGIRKNYGFDSSDHFMYARYQ